VEIVVVSALCISGVLMTMYLGEQHKVFGQVLTLALSLVLMFLILNKMEGLLQLVEIVEEIIGGHGVYIKIVLKMTGIILVAEFTSDLCEQSGYKVIGKQALLFGRLAVLTVGYPMLLEFIELIRSFLS